MLRCLPISASFMHDLFDCVAKYVGVEPRSRHNPPRAVNSYLASRQGLTRLRAGPDRPHKPSSYFQTFFLNYYKK